MNQEHRKVKKEETWITVASLFWLCEKYFYYLDGFWAKFQNTLPLISIRIESIVS